jgi:hypothetical protein
MEDFYKGYEQFMEAIGSSDLGCIAIIVGYIVITWFVACIVIGVVKTIIQNLLK